MEKIMVEDTWLSDTYNSIFGNKDFPLVTYQPYTIEDIHTALKSLQEEVEKVGGDRDSIRICFESCGGYGDDPPVIRVSFSRIETDKEYKSRRKIEKIEKERQEKAKKSKEEKEYKQYLKLKEKFDKHV